MCWVPNQSKNTCRASSTLPALRKWRADKVSIAAESQAHVISLVNQKHLVPARLVNGFSVYTLDCQE